MRGNNTLTLNEATLIEAIQEYLNKRIIVDTPKVVSVTPIKEGMVNTFSVNITEQERESSK